MRARIDFAGQVRIEHTVKGAQSFGRAIVSRVSAGRERVSHAERRSKRSMRRGRAGVATTSP